MKASSDINRESKAVSAIFLGPFKLTMSKKGRISAYRDMGAPSKMMIQKLITAISKVEEIISTSA